MENRLCFYDGCNELVNRPHHVTLCVFHAPVEKKGVTVNKFNEMIFEKTRQITEHNEHEPKNLIQQDYNFRGYIFPGPINFTQMKFTGNVEFTDAKFSGQVLFGLAEFTGITDFGGAEFAERADFFGTQFNECVNFAEAQFSNLVQFSEGKFSGNGDFSRAVFSKDVNFRKTAFLMEAKFSFNHFERNVNFEENIVGGTLFFEEITFGDMARFYFRSPRLKSPGMPDARSLPSIIYEKVLFRPFYSYFESIRFSLKGEEISSKPIFIFRYCELKDVYFTNNDMTLFSFYKSSFDQARFISSQWSSTKDRVLFMSFDRNNVIPEEVHLEAILQRKNDENYVNDIRVKYMLQDLSDYGEVASLYRRMKTALDYSKDYQQASWFYFNEFEMKRRALEEEIENSLPKWRIFQWRPLLWFYRQLKKIFSKYVFYFSYKVFAGFGEKPWWSFIWFWIITIIFAFGHMVFGLEYFPGGVVETKYEFFGFLKHFDVISFLKEFGSAFGYAVTQAIPKNYIPYKLSNLNPTNPFGIVWSITNTVTLWILIIFIAIGLKRHFRRF